MINTYDILPQSLVVKQTSYAGDLRGIYIDIYFSLCVYIYIYAHMKLDNFCHFNFTVNFQIYIVHIHLFSKYTVNINLASYALHQSSHLFSTKHSAALPQTSLPRGPVPVATAPRLRRNLWQRWNWNCWVSGRQPAHTTCTSPLPWWLVGKSSETMVFLCFAYWFSHEMGMPFDGFPMFFGWNQVNDAKIF